MDMASMELLKAIEEMLAEMKSMRENIKADQAKATPTEKKGRQKWKSTNKNWGPSWSPSRGDNGHIHSWSRRGEGLSRKVGGQSIRKSFEVEHEKFPKEHMAVETGRTPKKWHRGWNLAAECCQKRKEWTQVNCGSWRKSVTAGMKMTHCGKVAQHKGNVRKNRTRDKVVQGTLKGQMLWRRQWAQQECNKRMRNRDLKELWLESIGNVNETFRKTRGLEIIKRISVSSVGLQKIKGWISLRGLPPPK